MNPITFNERFLKLLNHPCNEASIRAMADSPLIKWEEPTAQDFDRNQFPEAFFPNKCPRLPFDNFRVDGFYHYLGDGFMKFRAWVSQIFVEPELPGFTVTIQIESSNDSVDGSLFNAQRLSCAVAGFTGKTNKLGDPIIAWLFDIIDVESGELINPVGFNDKLIWSLCGEWINKLCIDFCNPHLFLCKKHPKLPNGKSANWIKQREHFVLLHKSHPANRVDSVGKTEINHESSRNKMSHSRRAHFRLLSSPRFKNKKGQRVWVKSTWVGPKEWSDRSGQIYKIVERETK